MTRTLDLTRRVSASLAAVLIAVVMTIALPGAAAAHSGLESSTPKLGDTLTQAPTSVSLVFSEEMRDFAPQVAITIGKQKPLTFTPTVDGRVIKVDLSDADLPSDPSSILWKVGYRVVSGDGHPASGVLEFSVADHEITAPSVVDSLTESVLEQAPTTAVTDATTSPPPGQEAGPARAQESTTGLSAGWMIAAVAAVLSLAAAVVLYRKRRTAAR